MSVRVRLGLLATVVLLAVLLRPAVDDYLAQPLGFLYSVAARYLESVPQIYLWAGLLGLFALIGLRRIPLGASGPQRDRPRSVAHRGRLGEWVQLLDDRQRGAYFEWRLANRLAELDRWIGAAPQLTPELGRYLEIGRTRRTIEPERDLSRVNFGLERLVGYLESALDRS